MRITSNSETQIYTKSETIAPPEPNSEPVSSDEDNDKVDDAPRRRDKGLQNPLVMTLLFILWMTCQKYFQRLIHLLMQSIGKRRSIVRWTPSCPMGLGRSLIVQAGGNQLDASGFLKRK